MTPQNFFKEALVALAKAKVNFVITGGVAMVLHGVERFTADLDLSVDPAPENVKRFLRVMEQLEMKPSVPVAPEALLDQSLVDAMIREKKALVFTFVDVDRPFRRVDFFISRNLSYERLRKDSKTVVLGGETIRICSSQLLLDLKLEVDPPRDKDLFDIKQLRKLNEQG